MVITCASLKPDPRHATPLFTAIVSSLALIVVVVSVVAVFAPYALASPSTRFHQLPSESR